jgi:hypothetical protein
MHRLAAIGPTSIALLSLAIAVPAGGAIAQQTQHVSFKASAENSKYTQQQFLDVGDVPGHQVRSFEIHRTFPANAPVIAGMKIKELWTRGTSDYVDGNGAFITYGVNVLENGDKFFTRGNGVARGTEPGKYSTTTISYITGGTGKLAGIQGIMRTTGSAEPKANINETEYEIEYSLGK